MTPYMSKDQGDFGLSVHDPLKGEQYVTVCVWQLDRDVPGESTLRRDFIRRQQENKERSEALRRQQLLQEQQLREQEEYKRAAAG